MVTLEDGVVDFQEWVVPTSWEEVTLKQFQNVERLYDEKESNFTITEVLQAFTDKPKDEIDALPLEFSEKMIGMLDFVNDKIQYGEPHNYIDIDGERYTIHFENQLRTGEYIAADAVIKADPHNYAGILAILCRKEGEVYDSHYENEVLPSRIEMFENIPVTKIMPLIGFFLNLSLVLLNNSQLYSMAEEMVKSIQQDIKSSRKNGALWRVYMLWQTKKLRKLLRSIKYT